MTHEMPSLIPNNYPCSDDNRKGQGGREKSKSEEGREAKSDYRNRKGDLVYKQLNLTTYKIPGDNKLQADIYQQIASVNRRHQQLKQVKS